MRTSDKLGKEGALSKRDKKKEEKMTKKKSPGGKEGGWIFQPHEGGGASKGGRHVIGGLTREGGEEPSGIAKRDLGKAHFN